MTPKQSFTKNSSRETRTRSWPSSTTAWTQNAATRSTTHNQRTRCACSGLDTSWSTMMWARCWTQVTLTSSASSSRASTQSMTMTRRPSGSSTAIPETSPWRGRKNLFLRHSSTKKCHIWRTSARSTSWWWGVRDGLTKIFQIWRLGEGQKLQVYIKKALISCMCRCCSMQRGRLMISSWGKGLRISLSRRLLLILKQITRLRTERLNLELKRS